MGGGGARGARTVKASLVHNPPPEAPARQATTQVARREVVQTTCYKCVREPEASCP